jgi:hypothetical protein
MFSVRAMSGHQNTGAINMAIWQFKFSLVPQDGVAHVHGYVLPVLLEYKASTDGPSLVEDGSFPNYWRDETKVATLLAEISSALPEFKSWADDARMFGEPEGNKVEVWIDEVTCFVDMRNISAQFVQTIVAFAMKFGCYLAIHGSGALVAPDVALLAGHMETSDAWKFCRAPEEFLKSAR